VGEVWVEGKKLDVFEGFNFSFNYSIADVRHPDKRNTEYSKTIQCPATQNNDTLFGQIYDVNISNAYNASNDNIEVNFNPNKKARAEVMSEGVNVMRGTLQLRKIVRRGTDYIYEVAFLGKLVDIFGVLGDKQLNGLDEDSVNYIDFSDLDHDYTQANQIASWTATYGEGYVYPMLDYGTSYVYEYYQGEPYRNYYVEDFRPALYLKEIIDRIFAFAGFSYTSSFLSSAFFKRLIVPIGETPKLTEAQATARSFKAVKNLDQIMHRLASFSPMTFGNEQYFTNWGEMAKLCFEDDSLNGFDNNNQYRILSTPADLYGNLTENNYIFVCQQTQRTDRFKTSLDLKITKNFSPLNRSTYTGQVQIMKENSSTGVNSLVAEAPFTWDLDALAVGESATQTVYVEGEATTNDNDNVYVRLMAEDTDYGFTPDFRIQVGSTVRLDFRCTGGYFINEPIREAFFDGDNINLNSILPEVGMADLLKSVINMFNLYVTTNPNQENNLLIETRDDFYEGGEVKDWTHKLDYSKEVTLEPLALLTANEFEYTYKEDSDYYNERYQDAHGHTYGRARIDVDNDFLQNTNKTEVVFSPTPLVNDGPSNRIIGKIYDSDIEEGAQPTDHNIRVLYYGGLLVNDPRWVHQSINPNVSGNYMLSYPYAGHLTHPTAPAQDINFGIPSELFYAQNDYTGTLLYTNDNLFNRYHRRGLLEITNKDSKLKTAYFYLTPSDIHKLDFRDQILIDNSYWRINRVMDYNPFNQDLTKVELIKVITKEPLKAQTFEIGTGGTIEGGSGVEKRPTTRKSLKNGNSSPLFGGIVRGKNNEVEEGVTSFMVQGNRNKVKKGSKDVTIIGDDNTVEEGVTAVRLINTNGVTVTDSNVTFVNNRQQESSDVLEGGLDEVRDLNGGTNIFTVDGGLNTVQAQFSETSIYIIEGGNN